MLLPSYLDEGILNNNHLFLIDALKSGRILNRPPFERAPLQTLLPPPIEASELGSVCRDTYLFFIGGHKKEGRLSCKPTFLPMGKAGCFLGRDRLIRVMPPVPIQFWRWSARVSLATQNL